MIAGLDLAIVGDSGEHEGYRVTVIPHKLEYDGFY